MYINACNLDLHPTHNSFLVPRHIQGRKFKEYPLDAVIESVQASFYAIFHPIEVAQMAYKLIGPAVKGFLEAFKVGWWIKDPARGSQPEKSQ